MKLIKRKTINKKISEPIGIHQKIGHPKKNSGYAENKLIKNRNNSFRKK